MTFSIIIAAYNIAPYIRQAVDSCIHQVGFSSNEYEVIIIDDGSTDATSNIVDEYSSLPFVRVQHQQNKGLSGTRNAGIQLAQGEFILFLDGDDWLHPSALNYLSKRLDQADLIVFPMVYFYSQDKVLVRPYDLDSVCIFNSSVFLRDTLGHTHLHIIPAPCKCYKRSILLESRQFFIEGILHEDNPFFAATAYNFNRIAYINEGLYFYRQNRDGSITNSQTIRNFNGVKAGNESILELWGFANKYINYMVSCVNVFQVIMNYNDPHEVKIPLSFYSSFSQRKIAFRQLLNYPFIPKALIRHLMLLLSPVLLRKLISFLYTR